jgi:hypothetical protein
MKENSYIFRERNTDIKVWFMLVIIMCLVVKIGLQKVNELKLRQEQNTLQEQYRVLQNKNYLVLDVDTSCTKQLLNSKDGIIRIMVTK